jgi:hypothetical protein
MAKVQVQITVSKVAENGDYKGRVISGWETFQINVKGEQITKKRQWTMWLELPSGITKDDVVTFVGELGTKAGSFEKDGNTYQVVEHSLNHPTYTVDVKAVPLTNTAATNAWNNSAPTHDPSNPPF